MRTLQSAFYFPLSAHSKVLRFSPASSPTVTEHIRHSSSYLNEGTLNSDLVVLLAALLCALICALGLNSLFKCSLRCSRQMVLHSSDNEVAISLANTRLKKEAMKALPIIVYTATSHPADVSTDCPICLAEFVDGETLRLTPMCNHSFHVECIDQWLFSHSSCPVCRHCLNLHGENKKPGSAVINEATESSNTIHIVID